jgi:hypothetical protein
MVDQATGRPYAQIDVFTLRHAISQLYPSERDVLDYIVSCANPRNIAGPGIAKIADGCDLRVEDTMKIIDALIDRGWIAYARKGDYDPLTGMQLPNAFMVNPDYLILNPKSEHYEIAMKMAQELFHTSDSSNEESTDSKTTANFGIKPPPGTTAKTTARNHQQEPPPVTTTKTTEGHNTDSPEKGGGKKRRGKPNDSNADGQQPNVDQSEQDATAARSAQESSDTVAHGKNETSIVACRRVVDNFESSAGHALRVFFRAQQETNIRDAMAWITATTKRHYFKQQQRTTPAADDTSKYTGGEYADFIES